MRKILATLILSGLLALPVTAIAQMPPTPPTLTWPTFYSYVTAAIWWIFAFVAIIMFIIAGFLFLTAGGDPDRVAKARNAFLWGVIGVVVAILAYSILRIITYLVARA